MSQATPTAELFTRLDGRHRVLELQRRRFWRELGFSLAILTADALTIAVVFALLAQLPLHFQPLHGEFVRGLIPSTPGALGRRITLLVFCLTATRAYTSLDSHDQSGRILLAIVLGILLPRWTELLTVLFLPRIALSGAIVLTLWLALYAQRRKLTSVLAAIDPRRLERERTILVGAAEHLQQFAAERSGAGAPLSPAYAIDESWPGDKQAGWHTLYEEVFRSRADAIILVGPMSDAALQNVLIAGSSAGCRVYGLRRRPLREMNSPTLLKRGDGPIALLSSPALIGWQLVAKRMLDVFGAAIGLVVLSPLFLLLAVIVKLTSPGPVLFRQTRVGLGRDEFPMLKLRTMVRDADSLANSLTESNVYPDPLLFKVADDPRITPVGRFLRRSSLDELPQLWNVLRGEMSLVGPRPPLPREVAQYTKVRHFVRFEVAPGITGPWQVGGRNDITSFDAVVQLEQDYISGWTVWRDLVLLLRTIPAVLSMRGAL